MNDSMEASPMKAVSEELDGLREAFRGTMESYMARMEADIQKVQESVQALQNKKKISSSRLRDLRDMLTLLRHANVRVDKGRRKDLKKIDSVVSDLSMLTESWRKP